MVSFSLTVAEKLVRPEGRKRAGVLQQFDKWPMITMAALLPVIARLYLRVVGLQRFNTHATNSLFGSRENHEV